VAGRDVVDFGQWRRLVALSRVVGCGWIQLRSAWFHPTKPLLPALKRLLRTLLPGKATFVSSGPPQYGSSGTGHYARARRSNGEPGHFVTRCRNPQLLKGGHPNDCPQGHPPYDPSTISES
jgi:hypothetical protein